MDTDKIWLSLISKNMNKKTKIEIQNNLKKYFIYTRISQKWEYDKSLEQQEEVCRKTAEQHKIPSNALVFKEDVESAFNQNARESFEVMMDELFKDATKKPKDRKYGWIVFYKLDRISRNSADFQRIEKLLNEWYKFISCTETIENTPTWKLLFRMLSAFAIYESEKLSGRMIISQIYSILNKDFEATGWKANFWYLKKVENKVNKAFVDEKYRRLIVDTYIYYNQLAEANDPIERVTILIKEKHQSVLEKFEWSKWWRFVFWTPRPSEYEKSIIRKILDNYKDWAFKYDGCYCKKFQIKDERIESIVQAIAREKSDDSKVNFVWDIWMNQYFKFITRIKEYEIVNPILYQEVANKRRNNMQKKKTKELFWLFDTILYFQKENWTLVSASLDPGFRWDKTYYNYRTRESGGWTADSISEIKIENIIKYSQQMVKLHNEDRRNQTEKFIWDMFFNKIKKFETTNDKALQMLINKYTGLIQEYESAMEQSEDFAFSSDIKTTLEHYRSEQLKLNQELELRKNDYWKKLDIFMVMFSPDMMWLDRDMRARAYQGIFQRIVLTPNKEVLLEFQPWIREIYNFNVVENCWIIE